MATNRKNPSMADSIIEKDTKQSSDKVIQVFIRLMFLRIGDIDTLNERFYAKAYVEARWLVELNKFASDLSSENQERLTEGKSVSLPKYAESHWHPQLSIENSFGDLKQQIRYSAKKTRKANEVCICEHRDIKGLFWEKLELQYFPSDVQDLSISIASMFYDDKVILVPDSRHLSGVNREAFTNQQEWSLYERVNTEQKFIKEFLFQAADDEEDDDEDGQEGIANDEDRKRSLLVVKCHAARRSRYFYWNAYFLILLITLLAFCSYALPPSDTSSRIQILCTLLLTSIAFRWTVTRALPHISYLTSLDIYALLCIFILVTQTIWHAIIGALIYEAKGDHDIVSNLELIRLDRYICWISIIVFILMHIALISWLFLYPFRERKLLEQDDIQYRLLLGEKRKHKMFQNIKEESSNPSTNRTINVYVRLMFLRVGEIDTLNEKYQAQASIEARWLIDVDKLASDLSSDDQKRLVDGKSITLLNHTKSHWHPQLYIENALGDLKEQIRYSAKKSNEDNQIYVCEHRDIKGLFWEKLELQHFPSDVQDLSISIASMLYNDKVVLTADPDHLSGVNREAFVDQQEWSLYEHVDTEQRYVKEFLFRATDDKDDDDDQGKNINNHEDRKQSILTVTCHAARQSNYFYWNGYCLMLLITLVSFCIFAIPPHFTANRIQTSCTLLLTSITFRWTVNRSLPTISYLTSMDKYAIFCIFTLVSLCLWHTTIGTLIFQLTSDSRVTSEMWFAYIDQCVFMIAISIFILMHGILLTWVYYVPLKHRREMSKKALNYRQSICSEKPSLDYSPISL